MRSPEPHWLDRKSRASGVTGVQTCALPIWETGEGQWNYGQMRLPRWTLVRLMPAHLGRNAVSRATLARSEEPRVGSDWSSDVCSSDLGNRRRTMELWPDAAAALDSCPADARSPRTECGLPSHIG